ncbi:MAG: RagB/SusD family nutrient uptake outer membrane protein [Muribaculaceae bacterium]|nr:RagB/SusD family nutrient uptake outer membrane protein [Muribaculaceae bacterium]
MKKIFLSLLLAAGLLSSCDMDKQPVGTLDGENAIQSLEDAARYRNGLYSGLRGYAASGFFTDIEIQMDMFQATNLVGNRGILFASGDIRTNSGEIASYFSALYSRIASINYFLEKTTPLMEACEDPEDKATFARYIAEARFARAYYNAGMLDRFAPACSEEMLDAPAMGIAIVTQYYPTSDRSLYPGRSTQRESYKFIEEDLEYAYNALVEYEKIDNSAVVPMSPYVSSWTVEALQARLALLKTDYAAAATHAQNVIDSKMYTLASPFNYNAMWLNDDSDEILFLPYESSPDEVGSAIGTRWISIYDDRADYIPSYQCLMMYDDTDVRFDSYFDVRNLNFSGSVIPCYNFYKFPGNPDLRITANQNNIVNKPKPFRLSEMYLIVAEANAMLGKPEPANVALNTLRKQRHTAYADQNFTGNNLITEVRNERTMELIGEGFRMSDLRRWKQGFTRNPSHPEQPAIESQLWPSTTTISYQPNDHRYTWPIPSSELEVNPQMKGQQNPGW